eukprot:s4000_g12.t1
MRTPSCSAGVRDRGPRPSVGRVRAQASQSATKEVPDCHRAHSHVAHGHSSPLWRCHCPLEKTAPLRTRRSATRIEICPSARGKPSWKVVWAWTLTSSHP